MSKKTQNLQLRSQWETVAWSDVANALRVDASKLAKGEETKFVAGNYLQYYVIINTWAAMFREVSESFGYEITRVINRYGLVSLIREADDLASSVIHGEYDPDKTDTALSYLLTLPITQEFLLQLLRFPKRLTVTSAPALAESTVNGWLEANEACRTFGRKPSTDDVRCDWTHPRVGSFLDQMLNSIQEKLENVFRDFKSYYDPELGRFSSGVAADADKPLLSKLKSFAYEQHYIYDRLYPLPFMVGEHRDDRTATMKTVPKSYKTYRPIAMEPVYRQFHMQAIRDAMEKCLLTSRWAKLATTRDQEHNRMICALGASKGTYSTLDLSSASDLVSRSLFKRVFPSVIVDEVYKYVSNYALLPSGKRVKLHMLSTAGAAITFICEDVLFMAIAEFATEYVAAWNRRSRLSRPDISHIKGVDPDRWKPSKTGFSLPMPGQHVKYVVNANVDDYIHEQEPSVFGDDIIVDSRVAEFLTQCLEFLGFRVSSGKSFISCEPGYREACGVEYYCDTEVTCVYWPRKVISQYRLPESIESLCELQHRLWGTFDKANLFLTDIVYALEPRMTTHEPYTDCSDLWGNFRKARSSYAPFDSNKTSKDLLPFEAVQRYNHLSLKAELSSDRDFVDVYYGDYLFGDSLLMDQFYYADFLRNGPLFDDDPNADLFHITKSRRQLTDFFRTKAVWSYVKE